MGLLSIVLAAFAPPYDTRSPVEGFAPGKLSAQSRCPPLPQPWPPLKSAGSFASGTAHWVVTNVVASSLEAPGTTSPLDLVDLLSVEDDARRRGD